MRNPGTWPRGWLIAGACVIAVLLGALALFRYFTTPDRIEQYAARKLPAGYRIQIESCHYNPFRGTFFATGVSVAPDTTVDTPELRQRTRSSFTLPKVRASGVDLWALRRGDIDIDEVQFDNPEIRTFLDRRFRSKHYGKPRRMPHEVIQATDSRVRIGTIKMVDGDIRYSEKRFDDVPPGTFRFADFNATLRNLSNDEKRAHESCTIDIRTLVENSGALKATFNYDLFSNATKMDYQVAMGRMDARKFNGLLVNLKGVRILEGTIDSLSADIKVRGDVATGPLRIPYHGLKFEVVNKGTDEQDFLDKLWTAIFDGKANESNPDDDDEPVEVVNLQYKRLPNDSIIKFVWHTLREGALKSANVPRTKSKK
jgi:hypothetical protein